MANHGSHDSLFHSETGSLLSAEDVLGNTTVPELSEAPVNERVSSLPMHSGAMTSSPHTASARTSALANRRQVARMRQRLMAAANAAAPPVMGDHQTPIEQTTEANDPAIRAYEYLSTQIQREMQTLREENASLQYRVAVFQQLFQNKERLVALLRSLGFNASVIELND